MDAPTVLTEAMILAKSKLDSLTAVKNLNMWGNSLCDVSALRATPNVEVLSLSVNQIRTLAPFGSCRLLAELYLRKNDVVDLAEVAFLHVRIAAPLTRSATRRRAFLAVCRHASVSRLCFAC
jgi:hypothetical protein